MGNPVDSQPGGVQDSASTPAISKITANQRVKTPTGPIGILTDVPQFTGASVTGLWTLGAMRVKIMGIPVIHTASVGVGIPPVMPPPTSGPLKLGLSDPRVKAL